jgi:hypothetical protein
LRTKRKYRSPGETQFLGWLHKEIAARGGKVEVLVEGNIAVQIPGLRKGATSTLFCCHTDTVHAEDGGYQNLEYDPNFGHIMLGKLSGTAQPSGTCLGADDGAGIWLMLEMIKAKVPGTYLFHRGEECGGIGSSALARQRREWLEVFDVAIAFDRPRNDEVITHQRSRTRCASDEYGSALVEALNQSEFLDYKTSDRGSFTDTFNYRGIISECLNLGVGYQSQHGAQEFQDYGHLVALRDQLIKIDWQSLKASRDPSVVEERAYSRWGGWGGWDDLQGYSEFEGMDNFGHGRHGTSSTKGSAPPQATRQAPASAPKAVEAPVLLTTDDYLEELRGVSSVDDYRVYVENDPEWAAEALFRFATKLASMKAVMEFLGIEP